MVKGLLVSSTGEQGQGTTGDWKLDVCSGIHQIQDTSNLYLQHNTGQENTAYVSILRCPLWKKEEQYRAKQPQLRALKNLKFSQVSSLFFFFFNTTKKQNKTAQQDLVQMWPYLYSAVRMKQDE